MKEKTADEMFEKLGYNKEDYGYKITYTKSDNNEEEKFIITIMLEAELIFTEIDDGRDEIERRCFGLQMQELQAINKKVEELGWMK